jgi:energy-coupling factor transporter ATP-binding protein EcfA2
MTCIVKISNLWWKYSDSDWVLKNIDLEIEEGEFVLILGATGAGKTTLLRSINGLIPHGYPGTMKGIVKIMNIDTINTTVPKLSKIVGSTFEDPESQIIWNTVLDEVVFPLENAGLNKNEIFERTNWALKLVKLLEYINKAPYQLSGGQKQRLSLAAALVMKPKILVLDEPMSQLDPQGRKEVAEALYTLRNEYKSTIIIAEHNIDYLIKFVDKIVLLKDGTIIKEGDPYRFYRDLDDIRRVGGAIPEIVELSEILLTKGLINDLKLTIEELIDSVNLNNIEIKCEDVLQKYTVTEDKPIVIQTDNVGFTYPTGSKALENINLVIREGEFVSIIGVNGSGKTTLAKTFNGLLYPTEGKVAVYGRSTKQWEAEKLIATVGYVFQNPIHQISNKTVYDEVAFGLRNLGFDEIEIKERVLTLLEKLDLLKYKDKHPYNISRADQFRVIFASILAISPKIYVVDEPTTGQDPLQAQQVFSILKEENTKGKTVIVITHHLKYIAKYSPRTIILHKGKKIFDGTTREAFSNINLMEKASLEPPETSKFTTIFKDSSARYIITPDELKNCITIKN